MANKITCTCGHSWNTSDSSKKDAYVCHVCGKNIKNMQLGGNVYPASYVPQAEEGWLSKYEDGGSMQEHQENYNDSSVSMGPGFVGMGNNTKGRNYSPAWGGQFEDGGDIPQAQVGKTVPFDEWYKTVPKDKNDTSSYNLRRAYDLAPQEELNAFVNSDAHLHSAYENPQTGIWEFMKSKEHPTIQKELDWFNSNKRSARNFRNNYSLDTSGNYYQYVPKHAMGGSLPGSVGFFNARTQETTNRRTKNIPSKGPYGKKTMASAQNGQEMKFYQEGLDWTPKNISKQGSKIKKDDNGYWNPDNWGKPVEIGSNNITMQGVNQPLIGISDTGHTQMMYPGEDYTFDGDKVTEYPIAQDGWVQRAANANLNFWEKCGLASSADNGGIRGGGGGGYSSPKYKNAYEEISDIKAYDKDQRKGFQKSLPEGVDIADWVAINRDASRMNALLRNPEYDKYTDSTGTLVPEYQGFARQFDPYYLYYKPAFAGKKQITPEDVLKYHQSQPGGLAGYKELVNRRYMPEKKKQGGWLEKYK